MTVILGLGAIVQTGKLAQVVGYSLLAGVGISAVFGLGVSSVGGLLDAMRERRIGAAVGWGTLVTICSLCVIGAVVLGIVVMSTK
jgi:hypothetical protein